ncbi:MAG: glycosyltransferase family A protein [candidate division WOR-3 bacterium]
MEQDVQFEQIYLIVGVNTDQLILNQDFALQNDEKITTVVIPEFMIENEITDHVIVKVTEQKQSDEREMVSKPNSDPKAITSLDQILFNLAFIQILLDAISHSYGKIIILDTFNYDPAFLNNLDVLNSQLKKHRDRTDPLLLTTDQYIPFLYLLSKETYDFLIIELSCMIHNIKSIISDGYPNHISKTTTKCHSYLYMATFTIRSVTDLSDDPSPIIQFCQHYYQREYNNFIKSQHLTDSESHRLYHLITKHPYHLIKRQYSQDANLDFNSYLLLCLKIDQMKYLQNFNVIVRDYFCNPKGVHNLIYFDRDFFFNLYPSYRQAIKNPDDALNHFRIHGYGGKLIPNRLIYTLTRSHHQYLCQHLLLKINSLQAINQSTDPIIYILTRTSNRPSLFDQCVQSILQQQYPKTRHLVSYDTNETYQYVKNYSHIYRTIDLISYRSKIHPNQYIEHFYQVLDKEDDGWILVLDDDDKFMTNSALHYLKQYLNNPDNLVIWMFYRNDKFIYPQNKNFPILGEIASCCYLYHKSKMPINSWGANAVGDYSCFQQLYRKTKNYIYVDLPLTGINYEEQISGWSAM